MTPENPLAAPRDSESHPFRGPRGLRPHATMAVGRTCQNSGPFVSGSIPYRWPIQGPFCCWQPSEGSTRGGLRCRTLGQVRVPPGVLLCALVPEVSCTREGVHSLPSSRGWFLACALGQLALLPWASASLRGGRYSPCGCRRKIIPAWDSECIHQLFLYSHVHPDSRFLMWIPSSSIVPGSFGVDGLTRGDRQCSIGRFWTVNCGGGDPRGGGAEVGSVGRTQWTRKCHCKQPEASSYLAGGEQRARLCRPFFGEKGKLRSAQSTQLLPGPRQYGPQACLALQEDRAQPSACPLPLISLEGQPVAMAIAGRGGGWGEPRPASSREDGRGWQVGVHLHRLQGPGGLGAALEKCLCLSWHTFPGLLAAPVPQLCGFHSARVEGRRPAGVWAWTEVGDVRGARGSARWGWERLEKPPFT